MLRVRSEIQWCVTGRCASGTLYFFCGVTQLRDCIFFIIIIFLFYFLVVVLGNVVCIRPPFFLFLWVLEIGVAGCCVCDGRAGVSVFVHEQILSQVLAISFGAWGIL